MDFHESYFQNRQLSGFKRSKMYKLDFNYCLRNIETLNHLGKFSLLDVGCADGDFTQRFSKIADLYGIEINLQEAKKAFSKGIKIVRFDELDAIKPDVIILRGTLQHITPQEFSSILKFHPRILILLQTPNPKSFVYRLLNQNQVALLTPQEGFEGNLNLISLHQLKDNVKQHGFKIASISKPYFTTPYCNPLKDTFQLVSCLLNNTRRYSGSWKGNIFRMTISRGASND